MELLHSPPTVKTSKYVDVSKSQCDKDCHFFPQMTGGQNMVKIGCFGRTLRWEAPIISPNFAQLLGVWYLFEILHTSSTVKSSKNVNVAISSATESSNFFNMRGV